MSAKVPDLSKQFLSFVQQQAREMRAADAPPKSLDEWKTQRQLLRRKLIGSWGGFPKETCALQPRIVGEFKRDGYRVQKVILQTRPGILMTANAYVPDAKGQRPAVLCVHGHWPKAKQEPVVQSRCIGLAKLGFFVLMVDAFGAGERGIGKPLGEYHGEMVAATLWPTGLALAGLQVYGNMRAIDYLQSRPEVDPKRIGVTGASGGGNQTMYVGAIDERLRCVVPVCSVGTYQAYLGAACCMCEVTPAALSYTEESGVLALVAPRGLMLVNATRDAFQFSVDEAKKSLASAKQIFRLYGKETHARHAIFESKHDYNQAMREAMYGWMTLHLKTHGDGSPIAEPKFETEEPETLRCFPGQSRPDTFVTLPAFAAAEARKILKRRPIPSHREQWESEEMLMRASLSRVLGRFPKRSQLEKKIGKRKDEKDRTIEFSPEPGITVFAHHASTKKRRRGLAVLLDLELGRKAGQSDLAGLLLKSGWDLVSVDLRATGATSLTRDSIGRAADHNSAEWSMWIGRPLLGQWVWDVQRLLDVLEKDASGLPETVVIGNGSAAIIALSAAALDGRIDAAVTVGGMASYVSDVPYEKQRLGIMAPGILRDVGDVPHLASLILPRRLVIAGGVDGGAKALSIEKLKNSLAWTRAAFDFHKVSRQLKVLPTPDAREIVKALSVSGQTNEKD